MATAHQQLRADADAIRAFLVESVGSSYHLACITPDGPISYHHFGDDADAATNWAVAENTRGRGVYWTTNRVRDGFHGKPAKGDIVEARFVHVDVDPPKDGTSFDKTAATERLRALGHEPSFVIDSGGGLQAFWRLEEPSRNLPAIEDVNMGVRDMFAADHCWNIDRLMRLPGTINWPDRKKIVRGRQPALAVVLVEDQGTFHDPIALAAAFPRRVREQETRPSVEVNGPYALLTSDDLALSPFNPLRSLIDHPQGRDRSGDALACAGRMTRDGFSDAQIMGVLMNPANAVHAHIGDQRDPRYQALRCIEKARTSADHYAHNGAEVASVRGSDHSEDASSPGPRLLPLIDPAAWEGVETPGREWALNEWIPLGQATYLTGPGSAGKSLLTQQLCTCIALGLPFMGVETRQAVAVYITCEDDADELHRRQKAICAALGVQLGELSGKLHLVSLMGELGNELIAFDDRDHATPTPRFAEILATAIEIKAGFVALDNVAHLTADEIARNKVAAFVNMLNRLARDIGGSVLFLGHPNKVGDQWSGSTAWENQVRSRLFLETPKDADGSAPDPDVRELSRGKANYARNGEAITFRWHQWAFLRHEDMPANAGAEMAANIQASAENDAFLKCLAKATEECRATSLNRSASNFAPRVFAKMTGGKSVGQRGFEAAMERLLHLGAIKGDQRVYQRANRTWAMGIGCTNPRTNPAQSDAQSLHEPATNPRTNPHTGSCPTAWCRSGGVAAVIFGQGRIDHAAIGGNVTSGSSLNWATLSSVM